MAECKICGNKINNKEFTAKEMIFGLRDEFNYLECGNCGCLQIINIPKNLSSYYPSNYYSYNKLDSNKLLLKIKAKRDLFAYRKKGLYGHFLLKLFGPPSFISWLKDCSINFSDRILDVGSGDGYVLRKMHNVGFHNLVGIDPFISQTIDNNEFKIFKKEIFNLDDKFDLIMMHHSFEHMDEPLHVLEKANRLLKEKGKILIRIPVAGTFAWNHYKANWAQLDPPRHLFLHTTESIKIIAEKTKFRLTNILFDSNEFQFWASEQYKNNIPLMDSRSYYVNPKKSIFNKEEIFVFKKRANELNITNEGDQACFYLEKI